MRKWSSAMLLATACSASQDVTLELRDADGDAGPRFADVMTLSIEAVATAGRCRLAHQCAFRVEEKSLAGIEQALRGTDVLLELAAGEAQTLVLNGRPTYDCFPRDNGANHPVVCAYARLDEARDGTLVLELEPDLGGGECPESIELCP